MNECPCKTCKPPKRKVGCHGYCLEYKNWKKLDMIRAKREKEAHTWTIDLNCAKKWY